MSIRIRVLSNIRYLCKWGYPWSDAVVAVPALPRQSRISLRDPQPSHDCTYKRVHHHFSLPEQINMEAASARMATRNQFEGFEVPRSSLERFIYNACDPAHNFEPNLALNLEIVDMINSKKGNSPREAAVTIVRLINHRNPNVALLALGLLDNCVKNCGYPFHLQISTKEFLNELVRRFPERPPIRASRVQSKILEAIEEWRQTICQTSRYKEDLGFIRDMHRLLLYKGYMFPEVRRDDAAVLNPSDVCPYDHPHVHIADRYRT